MTSMFSEVTFSNKGATGKILGRGSFIVGGSVKVQYSLFDGSKGPFVQLPSERDKNGKMDPETGRPVYYPHASFISLDARNELHNLVMEQYRKAGGTTVDRSSSQVTDDLPF